MRFHQIWVPLGSVALFLTGCAHKPQLKTTTPTTAQVVPGPSSSAEPATTAASSDLAGADRVPGLDPIHFGFDDALIRPQDQSILTAIGDYLASHVRPALTISGNCDERGTVEYNIALGDRRAQAARDYLVRMGVHANRIKTISYGKEHPLDPGHDEQAWAKNRRDDFELAGAQRAAR